MLKYAKIYTHLVATATSIDRHVALNVQQNLILFRHNVVIDIDNTVSQTESDGLQKKQFYMHNKRWNYKVAKHGQCKPACGG